MILAAAVTAGLVLGFGAAADSWDLAGLPQPPESTPENQVSYEVLPPTQVLTDDQRKIAFEIVREDSGFRNAFGASDPEFALADPLLERITNRLRGATVVVILTRPVARFEGTLPALRTLEPSGPAIEIPTRHWVVDDFDHMFVDVEFETRRVLAVRPGPDEAAHVE